MSVGASEPLGRLGDRLAGLLGRGEHAPARRGALLAFAVRIVSAGLAYASQILLARWMGADEYGIFAYCWVWLTVLGILAPAGLNTSVLRFLPEYEAQGRSDLRLGFIMTSRRLAFAIACVLSLAGALAVNLTGGLIDARYAIPLYLTLVCVPMFALADINEGISRAHSWLDVALIPPFILRPAILLVVLALALALGAPASAETAVVAAIVATLVAASGQMAVLSRRLASRPRPAAARRETRRWIAVSMPILLVEGFFVLLANTDVLVLNIYRGPAESAAYYAALKTTALVSFVYYAVTTTFAHRFADYSAAGDHAGLERALRAAVTWTFWPSLAAVSVILALGWPLLWLFGAGFTVAYPAMFILAIGLLARAAVGPIEYMLSMLGEEKACAGVLAVAAAANLGLNFALIPDYGLIGAAGATAGSTVLATFLLYGLAKRRLGLRSFIWRASSDR